MGLSEDGIAAIKEHEKHQWIIDVSHLNDHSFLVVVRITDMPLLASHSNARRLCNHERNLTDEELKAISYSGGLIGVNAYESFVDQNEPTIDRFIDHIIYIAELVGIDHVGFGFDFVDYLQTYNLGSDMSNMTIGLEDATKIPDLIRRMSSCGFCHFLNRLQ